MSSIVKLSIASIAFAVARERALDAFHHPFAHIAQRWR